jgi:D-alanine-D-alanine ligase
MKFGLTYTARSEAATRSRTLTSDDAEEEFDSPETIAAIAEALQHLGHTVELLGDGPQLAERLCRGDLPEFAFNVAEGRGISRNREAWVPALLEMFDIPHTGSDALTLSATLDKSCAKRLAAAAGIRVPAGVQIESSAELEPAMFADLQLPLIVKPALEGSSKGIRNTSLVETTDQLVPTVAELLEMYQQPVLVEEFIDGDELTVGVIGNSQAEVLGIMRVVPLNKPRNFVYSLEVKRDWRNQVHYETPARLKAADDEAVRHAALTAFKALGCRDVARIDFRLRNGAPYFLEVNPLPGLTPGSSDLVLMAAALSISYQDLIARIVEAAAARYATRGELVPAC